MSYVTFEGNIVPFNRDRERVLRRQLNELMERIAMLENTIGEKDMVINDLKQKSQKKAPAKKKPVKKKAKAGKKKK